MFYYLFTSIALAPKLCWVFFFLNDQVIIEKKKEDSSSYNCIVVTLFLQSVTIVGNSGNGECIVTTIFQRSFDPKAGHMMELKIERLN